MTSWSSALTSVSYTLKPAGKLCGHAMRDRIGTVLPVSACAAAPPCAFQYSARLRISASLSGAAMAAINSFLRAPLLKAYNCATR